MRVSTRAAAVVASLGLMTACGEAPVAPRITAAPQSTSAAVHDRLEFDLYNNFDIPLSCVTGTTHWEGWVHVTIETVTTPSGLVSTRFRVEFDPAYFVEMPDGTRYHPVQFKVMEHHLNGAASIIAGTAAGVFRSDDGHTIPLGFHVQVVLDPGGRTVVDWKFTGACP